MKPVIVCIAKKEHHYIEEFVKYNLALGFKHIYLYDNEDTPTYQALLNKYKHHITVIHFPFNNWYKPVQYAALDHFINTYLWTTDITHVAHIDIDEYIVLKKHNNICEFINEYIVGDCQGIGMNWRFFGSSGRTKQTNEPVTMRFTMCEKSGNMHIKTLFKKDNFISWGTCHDAIYSTGYTKSTNNSIINGPFNHNIDLNVIQLNHYKSKTFPEFRYIRTRGRADLKEKLDETENTIKEIFNGFNINEVQDLYANNFYLRILSLENKSINK
jgi:hypothetical protein